MSKLLFAAAFGLAVLPVGAVAQRNHPDIHVTHADLDLSSPAGVKTLDRRIARAAETICSDLPHSDSFYAVKLRKCEAAVTQHATPQRDRVVAARSMAAARVASAR